MSLLTIAQGLSVRVGLASPTSIIGAPDRTAREIAEHANAAGEELARRVDWGQLTATETLTGDGTNLAHAMPAGFDRIAKGAAVFHGTAIVRPASQGEWATLTAVEGSPRYFILRDTAVRLWPYLANADTVSVNYQTAYWCDNGTSAFAVDDDSPLIDEAIFLKCLEVRWRREKGMDYADHEAEYEAALADFARNNDRGRF